MILGLLMLSLAWAAPQTPEEVIEAHRAAEISGDPAQFNVVADAWARLLKDPTMHPEQVRVFRAEALHGAGRLEEAAEAWEELFQESQDDAAWLRVLQIRGELTGQAVLGDAPDASGMLDRWLALVKEGERRAWTSPDVRQVWESRQPDLRMASCEMLHRLGRFEEVVERCEPLVQAGHADARALHVHALDKLGRTEEAIRLAHGWGGDLEAWASDRVLERALERAEEDPLCAADDFVRWADAHPGDPNASTALYNAAVLRIRAGDEDGGIAVLERLIRAHPDHMIGETRAKLAGRLIALARLSEALPHLEALGEHSLHEALLAGLTAVALGDRERAKAVLQPWKQDLRVYAMWARIEANALVPPPSDALREAHQRMLRHSNAGPTELAAFVELLEGELSKDGAAAVWWAWFEGTATLAVADRRTRQGEDAQALREAGIGALEEVVRAGALPELRAAARMELALRDAERDRTLPLTVLPSAAWGALPVEEALGAMRARPDDPAALMELVRALIAEGEVIRAVGWLQLMEGDEELPLATALLAQTAGFAEEVSPELEGELAQAVRGVSALIAGDAMGALGAVAEGTTPLARTLEGIAYLEMGAPDAAVKALSRAQGGPPEADLALGLALAALDDPTALDVLGRSTLPEARLAVGVLDPGAVKVHGKNRRVLRKDPGLQACGGEGAVLVGLVQGGRVEQVGFAVGPKGEDVRGCLVGAFRELELPEDGLVVWRR